MRSSNHRLSLLGALAMSIPSACAPDVPECPGQCFEYTVEYPSPLDCQGDMGVLYAISFTGTEPDGYRGRFCFNSTSVPLVVEAIAHRQAGGPLSELPAEVQSAYVSTVNAVRSDLEAECLLAAPGQCTNAADVCSVIAADAYAQLVIDETCVLSLAGAEPVLLAPGQVCEPVTVDQTTDSDDPAPHCTEAITAGASEGLDDTASGGADTTGDIGGMGVTARRSR